MNFPKKRLPTRSRLSYDSATGVTPQTVTDKGSVEDRRAAPGRVASRIDPKQQAIGGLDRLYSPTALKKAVAQAKLRRGKAN